jgi:replicative DNA helicase
VSRAEHVPPHDDEAEQAVLGSIMLRAETVGDVGEVVQGRDFYRRAHGLIFDALVWLYGRGEPCDLIATKNELQRRGALAEAGGPLALQGLVEQVPSPASAGHYAQIVAETATRRRLISAAADVMDLAYGAGETEDVVEKAEGLIYGAARVRVERTTRAVEDLVFDVLAEIQEPTKPGLPTGFGDLDEKLRGGLKPGAMVIVAARPGVGKSTLVANIARNAALDHNASVLVFSLEMGTFEIIARLLFAEARIPTARRLDEATVARLAEAADRFVGSHFWIDDSGAVTLVDIRAVARRYAAAQGLDLIVVDYLQLMSGTGRAESRQQEIAEISRGLKLLAKELGIPVIAVSQMNRQVEQRGQKARRPQLSDLRESGSLEQDSDVVIFLDRDDEDEGTVKLFVAKHRNGPTGDVTLTFLAGQTRFAGYSPGQGRFA